MGVDRLKIDARPKLSDGRMILALSGWMDGGEVSTGTAEWLVKTLHARKVAGIDPEGFCILNLPGSMEVAAMFRPYTEIKDGRIITYEPPKNTFYCDEGHDLVIFRGREPNFGWAEFAECVFSFASQAGVSTVYFIGSVGGAVPHTREPRLISTVSDESMRPALEQCGVTFTNYEGPASFSTCLLAQARERGISMASLVAEIPAYIQGRNPRSIEAVIRKLVAILGLQVSFDELRRRASEWEERLNAALEETPDLAKLIHKLEEDCDNEVFDTQMGDLKAWLQERGVRVD
ncbi:MAG TPA: PAC2 family protein [Phycisphaerae bacterium]|nr:PAC2 family protein [Phycisphaerae bacterium]